VAIYHFSVKVISRANGSSAVAAAAYRSASRLEDERLGRGHDFSSKSGVVHSEIMAPEGTPERWRDRETLWNEVEAGEPQKNSQLAREVEFAIPREMGQADGIELARDFVRREFVDRGMVADLNVHWDMAADGTPKPHAHVMLSMREADEQGFGKKAREWNDRGLLKDWREAWGDHVNSRLAELGIDALVDHRTLEAQGIGLEPQHKIGPAGARREERGEDAERALEHREIARRNGERVIAEPKVALEAITRQQSTFTDHDLARFVHRHTDDAEQYARAMSAVRTSPELVALGKDGRGRERFSSREMLGCEERLERSAEILASRKGHEVSAATIGGMIAAAEDRGLSLGKEQRDALSNVVGREDLAIVVGYAGTGKSAMVGVAREAWEAAGYQVRGAALSGIAAESLEAGSGIGSRTIASLEHGWARGRDLLTARDVLVIDEAGMIGSRQMDRVLAQVEQAGAKLVLVGDPEQLQAIEAGAAFRALAERHGAAEITQIRRQREDWQREATRELATGRTGEALERYEAAGALTAHDTRAAAREAVVEGWDAVRRESPEASQVMLAHTRADVAALNQLARARMMEAGALGEEVVVATERGSRAFAPGDRVMFLRNERSLEVKNGTLATVERVDAGGMAVRLDGGQGRSVAFDLKDYNQIDHGYASTIHKSQGVTVDHGHLLATDGLDRHGAYVGMSRHRESLSVHYGADDFASREQLTRTLGRERAKDITLDYGGDNYREAFAERRGFVRSEIEVPAEIARPEHARSRFASFKPKAAVEPAPELQAVRETTPAEDHRKRELRDGVKRYARAYADIERMGEASLPTLPHQEAELKKAEKALGERSRSALQDIHSALSRSPGLAGGVDTPEGFEAIRKAFNHELAVKRDPELRADRFVETWTKLQVRHGELGGWRHDQERGQVEGRMKALAGGLKRDPQLESILANRKHELGLTPGVDVGRDLGKTLVRAITRGLGIDMGMGR
jgi:Ti-type conjugative transfer relaxase TraA